MDSTAIPIARPVVSEEEIAAAVRVLRSGRLTQGREVAAFESEFAAQVAGRHCIAVASGTAALHLSLLGLGITAPDEVILPSFGFAATANVVRLVGATPVFADIDATTYCVDPLAVAAAIGPRTAAVIAVHLFGHPARMDQLTQLAERHGLALIEDACQAHAATILDRPVGAFGHTGAFSFYPTKNMHSIEGGMITTADPNLARTLRMLRNQGMAEPYDHQTIGCNARMSEVAAAIARIQLTRLATNNAARRRNAARLNELLEGVRTPTAADGVQHVYNQYTIRIDQDRDAVLGHLAAHGIGGAVYYPTPIHRLAAYDLHLDLPHTEQASREVLSLPVHPSLTDVDLDRICRAVNTCVPRSALA